MAGFSLVCDWGESRTKSQESRKQREIDGLQALACLCHEIKPSAHLHICTFAHPHRTSPILRYPVLMIKGRQDF